MIMACVFPSPIFTKIGSDVISQPLIFTRSRCRRRADHRASGASHARAENRVPFPDVRAPGAAAHHSPPHAAQSLAPAHTLVGFSAARDGVHASVFWQ